MHPSSINLASKTLTTIRNAPGIYALTLLALRGLSPT
jgi:hypothetical protein